MKTNPQSLLQAARAVDIPEGSSGLWYIKKVYPPKAQTVTRNGQQYELAPALFTHLFRITDDTLYKHPPGEVVMEDTPLELKRHLEFMLRARGKVLITGLGLGCVVRGCLANPNVEKVVCIEKSSDVLGLVRPYMPQDRLKIVYADALAWTATNKERFDCAWHDIWANKDRGEPDLSLLHTQLIFNCVERVGFQGAWGYLRESKRFLKWKGMRLVG